MVEKMRCFEELYESDYSFLANNARNVCYKKKANIPEELPLEKDIKFLRDFCNHEIKKNLHKHRTTVSSGIHLLK